MIDARPQHTSITGGWRARRSLLRRRPLTTWPGCAILPGSGAGYELRGGYQVDLQVGHYGEAQAVRIRPVLPEDLEERLDKGQYYLLTPEGIKAKHHRVARLLASGLSQTDVARRTGLTPTTIYKLKQSPAFDNLVNHYLKEQEHHTDEIFDRMEFLLLQLMDHIQDKLDDEEEIEDQTIGSLVELATKFLDRTGRGPVKKMEERSLRVTARSEQIAIIKQRINLDAPPGERLVVGEDDRAGPLGYRPSPDADPAAGSEV